MSGADWLAIFEGKALAAALTQAGHSVSAKTVQRWKNGETRPKPQDIRAIRELVGATVPNTKKEDPPPWARGLSDEILAEIKSNRRAVLRSLRTTLAVELARYGIERELGEQPHDELPHGSGGTPPITGVLPSKR